MKKKKQRCFRLITTIARILRTFIERKIKKKKKEKERECHMCIQQKYTYIADVMISSIL